MAVDTSNAAAMRAESERRLRNVAAGRKPTDPDPVPFIVYGVDYAAPGTESRTVPGPGAAPRTSVAYTDRRAGRMNKTEARYADRLELQRLAGAIARWDFEPMTLHLAPRVSWRPDFRVILADGTIELHEVKGRAKGGRYYATEKGQMKIRLASELHPFPIVVVWPLAGGEWGEAVYGGWP